MSTEGGATAALGSTHADVGIDKEAVKRAFLDKLFSNQGKFPKLATLNDYYMALARRHSFELDEVVAMPANNLTVVLTRQ